LAALLLAAAVGCAGSAQRVAPVRGGALRISEVVGKGDPMRRASTRLVLQGLAAADPQRGPSHFERAIKIDATNPYAYLALAAFEVQWGNAERGRQALDQAELLLESQQLASPRVVPHLVGLRGRADLRSGSQARAVTTGAAQGEALLERARRLAPDVWGDGWLSAAELR
jgi:hypothetical protein